MFFTTNVTFLLLVLIQVTVSRETSSISGGSLAEALETPESQRPEVNLATRSLTPKLENSLETETPPPPPEAGRIDLVKRMLEKTRHVQMENRRLRRRSPIPQGGRNNKKNNINNNNKNARGLLLNLKAVQEGAFTDGKETATQAPSLISKNNFINFCVSRFGKVGDAVIMNGKQISDKPACNGIPMGMVPDKNHLPACKFISPKNLDKIKANETLKVTLALRNLIVGIFTNPKNTYLEAPIQLDPETKSVLGHTHIVVQSIDSLESTKIPDPTLFFFFKGIDEAAEDGKVSVTINGGLPPGAWRISTINTGANHQAISSPIAQRSIYDDIIYITAE